MQNVRDYISVKLHTTEDDALKAVSNHTFKNIIILDENLVQTNHSTPSVFHNKPIAIGVAILELVNNIQDSYFFLNLYNVKHLINLLCISSLNT